MSKYKISLSTWSLISFWIVGIISFAIRAYINFSQNLLIGNGGYYPLQVRTVLERGELAFPDMPLLFYFEAGIVWVISLFDIPISNELILNVVMTVDSLSVPLLLIPLYQIFKRVNKTDFSHNVLSIALLSVLSFHTLNLVSSTQKNALAITLLFFTIASLVAYFYTKKKKSLVLAIVFFVLVGLTHFGTFSFALLFGVIFLLFRYKKKALIPMVVMLGAALALIYLFDPTRSERLLFAWQGSFSRLPNPSQLLGMLIYLGVAAVAIIGFRKYKHNFGKSQITIIYTLITLLIFIPLPIIDPQVASRLGAFLFIPLVLLILIFDAVVSTRVRKAILIFVGIISIGSVGLLVSKNAPADVSEEGLIDLENMQSYISNPDKTVVVARHNLEFWVAWVLHVDVSQESKFDDTLVDAYDEVFILNRVLTPEQKRMEIHGGGNQRSHFDEPLIPENAYLVYSSEHFKLYRYIKDDEL